MTKNAPITYKNPAGNTMFSIPEDASFCQIEAILKDYGKEGLTEHDKALILETFKSEIIAHRTIPPNRTPQIIWNPERERYEIAFADSQGNTGIEQGRNFSPYYWTTLDARFYLVYHGRFKWDSLRHVFQKEREDYRVR